MIQSCSVGRTVKIKMLKILAVLLIISLNEISSQIIPCGNFWKYIKSDQGTQGLITFQPQNLAQHDMKILLSVGAKLPSVKKRLYFFNF